LKIINKPKPESNELEKAKPTEKEPVVPTPTLPSNFEAPSKQPSLAQKIKVVQEKKFEAQPDQPWAELEKGGHFGFLGINTEQLKAHKEAGKEFTWQSVSTPVLVEEARPTGTEIDLGIVPQMAQEIVQEDRVESNEPPIAHILINEPKPETLIPEKIATKSNTEQLQLKALTMGEEKPFAKSFLHSTPLPPLKTIKFTKEQIDSMRASRVNALDKKPLLLKQEAEPIISPETNQPLSPEKGPQIKEDDPELTKLAGLTNANLGTLITDMGGNISGPKGGKKNKQTLTIGILELRKTQPALFTDLLKPYEIKKTKK
jgi:hypothetical protein